MRPKPLRHQLQSLSTVVRMAIERVRFVPVDALIFGEFGHGVDYYFSLRQMRYVSVASPSIVRLPETDNARRMV